MSRPVPAVFGSVFHEKMPLVHYQDGAWQPVQWVPSQEITLSAGAHVLHYGSECFEGMKAFRQQDDQIVLFRPDDNIARLQQSARLLHLPIPETETFKQVLLELVARAAEEVPEAPAAMYLRPTLIGTDPVIGKAGVPSDSAAFFILASPVGDYFKVGSPMKLLIETKHLRCAPHMGRIKCGGNYASALPWIMQAKEKYGANQVLFCPNGDVQETGATNFALIYNREIITKPLTDEFLHGITRASVLQIAKDMGYSINERHFTVEELKAAVQDGAEAILMGTAAVIVPVTSFIIAGEEITVQGQENALKIRQAITDIQYGKAPDPYGWICKILN